MSLTTIINGNVQTLDSVNIPNIDSRFGPYTSIEDVLSTLCQPNDVLATNGLTVGIVDNNSNNVEEYVFANIIDGQTPTTTNLQKKINNPTITFLQQGNKSQSITLNQVEEQTISILGQENSNWLTEDTNEVSCIINKPQIYSGKKEGSIVHGKNNIAYETYTHGEGESTIAHGGGSHSEGRGSITQINFKGDGGSNEYTVIDSNLLSVGNVVCYNNIYAYVTNILDETTITTNVSLSNENFSDDVELLNGISYGSSSHTEGVNCTTVGLYSHSEGENTIALNRHEHAEGKYNLSHLGNTLMSVGIGSSVSERKNALEVLETGEIFVYKIGGYDGTSITDVMSLQDVVRQKVYSVTGVVRMKPNCFYDYGIITKAVLNFVLEETTTNNTYMDVWKWCFKTGTNLMIPTITYNGIIGWANDHELTASRLQDNHYYEVTVMNGIARYISASINQ